jgi:adenylate kinase family enzyme
MKRILILGRGASGKSTLALRLGEATGLPVIELDKLFWRPGLAATPQDEWAAIQRAIVSSENWILEGDLGPYDVVEARLPAADSIIFLDFSFVRCAWRAIRRSRERADFWLWLLMYGRSSKPRLLDAIAKHAPRATLYVLRNPGEVDAFLRSAEKAYAP